MYTLNQIVEGLKSKDQKVLKYIIDHYSKALSSIAFGVVSNNEIAQEVLQSAYLKIWNNISQYDDSKASLYTWMARITRNTAIDTRRKKSFENGKKTDSIDIHVDDSKRTFQNIDKIDSSRLLEGLEDKYAIIINKLYLEGHTQSSLAKELNIPIGTIKTRLRKGMNILREHLEKETKLFYGIFITLLIILLF